MGLYINQKRRSEKYPVLEKIARKYERTTEQVTLRWLMDEGVAAIPGTGNKVHVADNLKIFDFALTEDERRSIAGLNKNARIFDDPAYWGAASSRVPSSGLEEITRATEEAASRSAGWLRGGKCAAGLAAAIAVVGAVGWECTVVRKETNPPMPIRALRAKSRCWIDIFVGIGSILGKITKLRQFAAKRLAVRW